MKTQKLVMALAVGLGGGVWLSGAFAAGNVDTARGEVSVLSREGQPRGVSKGDRVVEGETVITGPDGELLLTTDDSGVLAVRPRSRMVIETYKVNGNDKDSVLLNLLRGSLRSVTGWISKTAPKNYRVTTNTATVGIRGTDHEVAIVEDGENAGTWNRVSEGTTVLSSNAGSVEQSAGGASSTARVRQGDQAPTPAPPPLTLFAPRPSDQRVLELKTDAQSNQQQRLQTRQQQVSGSGGLSEQGNPRVSSQCTPNSPAQQALDALLRAYERGDIGFLQAHIDPAMVGYSVLINDIINDSNAQRQTRVQVQDRQMQCGPDVAVIDFAWEKHYLASANFQPVVTRGRGSVLISGLGSGINGQWRISGLVGDSPLRASGVGTDGSVQASASASFGNLPSGCTAGPVSGTATATLVSAPAMTLSFIAPAPAPFGANCSLPTVSTSFTCSISAPGVTPVLTSPAILFPNCSNFASFIGEPSPPGTGVLAFSLASATPTPFTGPGGSIQSITVPITIAGSGSVKAPATGTWTASTSTAVNCTANITLPAATPVCIPTPSNANGSIQVNDPDLNSPSITVQVQASNGDNETLVLPRVGPGQYALSGIPVTRGAASVIPNSGRFELVGATPSAVTLTIRYLDTRTANGQQMLRQATMVLAP